MLGTYTVTETIVLVHRLEENNFHDLTDDVFKGDDIVPVTFSAIQKHFETVEVGSTFTVSKDNDCEDNEYAITFKGYSTFHYEEQQVRALIERFAVIK